MNVMIRRLREARGLTQAELAKRAKLTQGYISQLEAGAKQDIGAQAAVRLAKALAVPVKEMLRGEPLDREKLASEVGNALTSLRQGKGARGIRTLADRVERIEEYGFIARILRRERDVHELEKWLTILLDDLINTPDHRPESARPLE
jgi:transcriptional regulator with XRE-family HTH domain